MDKCPQCNADRIPDENFCDSCGHKYATEPKAESNEPKVESSGESQSFEDYEKAYLKRVEAQSDEGGQDTSEGGQDTSEGGQDTSEGGQDASESGEPRGAIWIPNVNGGEQPIYFESEQKTVGRMDVSEYLKSQNTDPLQVSRKQFTFYIEDEKYYIVDGATSVQEKPSGNHTTVNGKDITEQGAIELNSEDKIGMSTVLDVTFRIS